MSEEIQDTLDSIYDDLKQLRDQIELKLHLASMELRDEWDELEGEWKSWTHQLSKDLGAVGEDVEKSLREAAGDQQQTLPALSSSKLVQTLWNLMLT